jgi:MFS family permease
LDRRLIILGYCLFLGPFGGVNVIIPMQNALQRDLSTSLEMITRSISIAMVPFALLQFFSGALADRWGESRMMIGGLAVYGVGALACGVAPEIWTFLLGRAVQGIGLAFFNPVALAMVGELVPGERRGYVMGWMGTINTAGIAGGPLAGGLAAEINWRLAYYLILAMTAAAVVLFWHCFDERPPTRNGAGVLGQLGTAVRVPALRLVCLGGFAAFFAYGAALTFTGKALEGPPFSYSEGTIGVAIGLGGLAGALVSPGAGWVSDRAGRGRVSAIGFTLALLSYCGFAFAGSLPAVLALFFLMGAAMAFIWAGLVTLSVEVIPGARNTSSTLFNASRFSGYALSPLLLVFVYTSSGLASVMAVSAAMALVGMAAAVALSRRAGGDIPRKDPLSPRKAGRG